MVFGTIDSGLFDFFGVGLILDDTERGGIGLYIPELLTLGMKGTRFINVVLGLIIA